MPCFKIGIHYSLLLKLATYFRQPETFLSQKTGSFGKLPQIPQIRDFTLHKHTGFRLSLQHRPKGEKGDTAKPDFTQQIIDTV